MDTNSAIIYIRVSTEEQAASGLGLASQEQRLRAYCEFKGLTVAAVLRDEAVSGGKPFADRPGGGQLPRLLKQHGAGHIVALKADRLFRSVVDAISTAETWQHRGYSLHIADMGGQAVDTSTATGWLIFTQLVTMAEFERRLIAERTRAGMDQLKLQGRKFSSAAPYGWQEQAGRLIPVAEQQAVIAEIQTARASGRSLRAIASDLNARGIPTAQGSSWLAATVQRAATPVAIGAR